LRKKIPGIIAFANLLIKSLVSDWSKFCEGRNTNLLVGGRCLEDVPEDLLVVLPELAEGAPGGLPVGDGVGPLPPATRVLTRATTTLSIACMAT